MSTAVAERTAGAPVSRGTRPRVPTVLLVVAAAVLAVNIAVLLAGAWSIGVTIDEPYHVDRLTNWFTTGWYLPEFQMNGDEPDARFSGLSVYGPLTALFAHVLGVIAGVETWGSLSAAPEAYAVRHIAVALISLLGTAAAAAAVRVMLRSWSWALVAAAFLTAIPTWTGHGMFNIKDVPVASGYTLITLAAVALARSEEARSRRLRLLGAAALTVGTVLLVGTRPGMVLAVLATGAAMIGITLVNELWTLGARESLLRLRNRAAVSVLSFATGYAVLVLVYPRIFASPERMADALSDSADYPWTGQILTAGVSMTMPPAPWYLPAWLFAQTPIVLSLLALAGLIAPAVLVWRRPRRWPLASGLLLVAVQLLLVPVYAVVSRSTLYDGTRQMLFMLPALAILATVAAALLVGRFTITRPRLAAVLSLVVAIGIVVPTVTAARLFPFSYTWFNAATAAAPIDGNWMTDYWWASDREVTPLLPGEDPSSCYLWKPDQQLISCGSIAQAQPYWPTRGSKADEPPLEPGQYYLMTFNRFGLEPYRSCDIVDAVTRPIFWREMTMSFISLCSVPLSPYPEQGLSFADAQGGQFLLWGWERPGGSEARWAWQTGPEVGFTLPAGLEGQDLRLVIDAAPYLAPGQASSTLDVLVNGTPVGSYTFTDGARREIAAVVPAAVLASAGDGRVVIRLVAPVGTVPGSAGIDPDGGADTDGAEEKKRSLQLRTLVLDRLDAS